MKLWESWIKNDLFWQIVGYEQCSNDIVVMKLKAGSPQVSMMMARQLNIRLNALYFIFVVVLFETLLRDY